MLKPFSSSSQAAGVTWVAVRPAVLPVRGTAVLRSLGGQILLMSMVTTSSFIQEVFPKHLIQYASPLLSLSSGFVSLRTDPLSLHCGFIVSLLDPQGLCLALLNVEASPPAPRPGEDA